MTRAAESIAARRWRESCTSRSRRAAPTAGSCCKACPSVADMVTGDPSSSLRLTASYIRLRPAPMHGFQYPLELDEIRGTARWAGLRWTAAGGVSVRLALGGDRTHGSL